MLVGDEREEGRKGENRERQSSENRQRISEGLREKERERGEQGETSRGSPQRKKGKKQEGKAEMGKDEKGEEKAPTCPGQWMGVETADGDLKRWLRGRLIPDSPGKWVAGDLPFSLTLEPQGPDSRGQRALYTHPSWPAKFYPELCLPQQGVLRWLFCLLELQSCLIDWEAPEPHNRLY